MIRLLTAVFLFSSFHAVADDVAVPNALSNNSVADANAVQQNFEALVDESNENDQRLADAESSIETLESYFTNDQSTTINASGWYTIAYLPCSDPQSGGCLESYSQQKKGSAYFMLRSDSPGKHQLVMLYASSMYGQSDIKMLLSNRYNQKPLTDIRIRQGATYDGALLQVYVDKGIEPVEVTARLTGRENEGASHGWNLVNWVADGDAIENVDYSLLTAEFLKPVPDDVQYLSDLSCTAGEVIEWNDTRSQWECATDPFAGLNCDVGDQLRMGSGGWECRAEPITASLIQNNWAWSGAQVPITYLFESVSNVTSASYCGLTTCYIVVPGVADHTSCTVQVTGDAVSGSAFLSISTSTSDIRIIDTSTWNEGVAVYINISCAP